mgnify:CR=1 FL=1
MEEIVTKMSKIVFDVEKEEMVLLWRVQRMGANDWSIPMPRALARMIPEEPEGKKWVRIEMRQDGFIVEIPSQEELVRLLGEEEREI